MAFCARALSKAPSTLLSASRTVCKPVLSTRVSRGLQSSQRPQQVRHKSYAIPAAGYKSESSKTPSAVWLRDSCRCSLCVDQSTSQKLFQTSQIPADVAYEVLEAGPTPDGPILKVKWLTDIPGFPRDHISDFDAHTVDMYHGTNVGLTQRLDDVSETDSIKVWETSSLPVKKIKFEYEAVMKDDSILLKALQQLRAYGFVFFQNVPGENGPLDFGKHIGRLRDTFYGETWDVKSVAQAKNIAYTHQFLGFHMDLLYFADPPGLQMLHCIKNSCAGGESLFTDSFKAAETLRETKPEAWKILKEFQVNYHYHNAGQHYQYAHPVLQMKRSLTAGEGDILDCVNYSPPFQAPFVLPGGVSHSTNAAKLEEFRNALEDFQKETEKKENIYEQKLEEGEMVLFNNRRVLHARNAFEPGQGERWLKGGYMDTDVVLSRMRTLREKLGKQMGDVTLNRERRG